ncbi:MAG: hypothetical protein GY803_10550, partial [Chloroflexi bacterium]|nr:hypothetical protein [Chloroflexota bacterium]
MEETHQSTNKTLLYIFGGCALLLFCMICLGAVALSGLAWYMYEQVETPVPNTPIAQIPLTPIPPTRETAPSEIDSPPTALPPTETVPPTETAPTAAPTLDIAVPDEIIQSPIPANADANLDAMFTADFPAQDYFDTAVRLGHINLVGRTVNGPAYNVGDIYTFIVDEGTTDAELIAATDHIYFWVDTELDYLQSDVAAAAERLEKTYYPRLLNLFGQEWQPGIDDDPHFSILHLSGDTDASELGYFSSTDEYTREMFSDSNEQELVYLIMGPLELGEDLYYGTMVHEVQHLIQWYMDPNEATWLNEGLSQLAEIYLGFDTVDTYDYRQQPDIQLNAWEYEDDVVDAHYAGAYLYAVYLWEQLGEDAIQELSRHPANGMAAVRAILQGHDPDRDLTQFTADWAAANFLDDPAAGPRYYYRNLDFSHPDFEQRAKSPELDEVKELNQFGIHYIDLDFRGETTVAFAGDTVQNLIDSPPRSGETMWFAPSMSEVDQRLTAVFDLAALSSATLKFATWYDLEDDYDFAYLSISTDNGASWELLSPDNARPGEWGPAFNGRSDRFANSQDGWLKESISLNSYVGQTVMIRFDVTTDTAVNGKGFALDDISIPELGYHTDVESGLDGWQAEGFVQTGWQLPQRWSVQLIEDGPNPAVTSLPLNHANQGQWPLAIGKGGGVLVIAPLTAFTT